ncbi:MAG: hypothetical protein U0P81_00770 [Holophagaceae bacterium]
MKGWVKVLLGITATFLLLGTVGAVQLVRSGKWSEIKGFSSGMADITRSSKAMERLDQEHPFTEPADGKLAEPRLLAYLEVCEALAPAKDPAAAWMREHAGKKGDFKDAAEAIGHMARLFDRASTEFEKRGMTAREFAWITHTVKEARREAAEKAGSPKALELLQDLRRAAADPGMNPGLRAELKDRVQGYEAWLEAGRAPLSDNAKVCLAHEARLKAADLGELGEILREGMAKGRRRGTVR